MKGLAGLEGSPLPQNDKDRAGAGGDQRWSGPDLGNGQLVDPGETSIGKAKSCRSEPGATRRPSMAHLGPGLWTENEDDREQREQQEAAKDVGAQWAGAGVVREARQGRRDGEQSDRNQRQRHAEAGAPLIMLRVGRHWAPRE